MTTNYTPNPFLSMSASYAPNDQPVTPAVVASTASAPQPKPAASAASFLGTGIFAPNPSAASAEPAPAAAPLPGLTAGTSASPTPSQTPAPAQVQSPSSAQAASPAAEPTDATNAPKPNVWTNTIAPTKAKMADLLRRGLAEARIGRKLTLVTLATMAGVGAAVYFKDRPSELPGYVPPPTPHAGDTLVVGDRNGKGFIRVDTNLFDGNGKSVPMDQKLAKNFAAGSKLCVVGSRSYNPFNLSNPTTVTELEYKDANGKTVTVDANLTSDSYRLEHGATPCDPNKLPALQSVEDKRAAGAHQVTPPVPASPAAPAAPMAPDRPTSPTLERNHGAPQRT